MAAHVASAGARGLGLFTTHAAPSGTLIPLGAPLGAIEAPGDVEGPLACACCGWCLGHKPERCKSCAAACYCSASCRETHAATGHALLCNHTAGDAAMQLSELLAVKSESALFLPLAVQITAAIVAEAAAGSAAR
eukprot:CAMPEP_0183350190 /NCGR_PEP_ID=MMETSP0164_2-20130417/17727_1 /TAXON_ID=221442 /ORGANISM="Coccolithus pelagicus ssp braarudi, Strain PLY182g" /LENGTH=134 /DNA_ID=CAMNT_0025522075 /DNA_START=122 /DNA_END=522 /DNA_ORIENTATION=+